MLATDIDVAIEWASLLPAYVMQETSSKPVHLGLFLLFTPYFDDLSSHVTQARGGGSITVYCQGCSIIIIMWPD